VASYAFYLVVVVVFSTLLIISVVRSILASTPPRPPVSEQVLSMRECADRADQLWAQLDEQRKALSTYQQRREMEQHWSRFRVAWLKELYQIESMCVPRSRSREPLKRAFELLERLQNLYATHAVQFASEIGGTLEEFHRALEAARK
jgi:hypothetical protein